MIRRIFLFSALVLFGACNSQHNSEQESNVETVKLKGPSPGSKQLDTIVVSYLAMQKSLVASDSLAAKNHANTLLKELAILTSDSVSTNRPSEIDSTLDSMRELLEAMKSICDITHQRANFALLTTDLVVLIQKLGLSPQKLYYDYCPMALNGKGAFWFTDTNVIRNPYFGEEMLTCGENTAIYIGE